MGELMPLVGQKNTVYNQTNQALILEHLVNPAVQTQKKEHVLGTLFSAYRVLVER